mgnify:CR=1 FL=1
MARARHRLRRRDTEEATINNAVNQVLSRTIVTSLTVVLVLIPLTLAGGEVLHHERDLEIVLALHDGGEVRQHDEPERGRERHAGRDRAHGAGKIKAHEDVADVEEEGADHGHTEAVVLARDKRASPAHTRHRCPTNRPFPPTPR